MNPLRPTVSGTNFNRIAHKEIVDHAAARVYTARSGRLRHFETLRQCLCELLTKNQHLRMKLMEAGKASQD